MTKLETLAQRLRWARLRKNYTQEEVADIAGTTRHTIAKLEQGAIETSRKLPEIASALGVDNEWLLFGTREGWAPAYVTQSFEEYAQSYNTSTDIKPEDLLELFFSLDSTQQERLYYMMNRLAEAAKINRSLVDFAKSHPSSQD